MNDLRQQLNETLRGRVCIVGVGNVAGGDDGAGVRLAEGLLKSELRTPKPERNPKFEVRTSALTAESSDFGLRSSDLKSLLLAAHRNAISRP